jgi:hypothetical protein
MTPVRRAIILVIATAMIAGGGWLLYEQLSVSTIIYGKFLLAGGALVFVGLVLLWEDIIAPMVRGGAMRRTDSDAS